MRDNSALFGSLSPNGGTSKAVALLGLTKDALMLNRTASLGR